MNKQTCGGCKIDWPKTHPPPKRDDKIIEVSIPDFWRLVDNVCAPHRWRKNGHQAVTVYDWTRKRYVVARGWKKELNNPRRMS